MSNMVTRLINRLGRVFSRDPQLKPVIALVQWSTAFAIQATNGKVYAINVVGRQGGGYDYNFVHIPGTPPERDSVVAADGLQYRLVINDAMNGLNNGSWQRLPLDGPEQAQTMLISFYDDRYTVDMEADGELFSATYTKQDGHGHLPPATVSIQNRNLRVETADGSIEVQLEYGTLNDLMRVLPEFPFFSAKLLDESMGELLVRGIQEFPPRSFEPDHFFYYPTSLHYQEMTVYGWSLQEQADRNAVAEKQLYLGTAEEEWLDFWGSFFKTPRRDGESDSAYQNRIIYQVIRATQNNVALELIVQDALGIDCRVLDAQPRAGELAPADQDKAPGRFLLDIGIDNDLTPEEVAERIALVEETVTQYKAAGTGYLNTSLRKKNSPTEVLQVGEVVAVTIKAGFTETLSAGLVYAGAGWRASCPGLVAGNNSAIREQVYVQKIAVADGSVAAAATYGG